MVMMFIKTMNMRRTRNSPRKWQNIWWNLMKKQFRIEAKSIERTNKTAKLWFSAPDLKCTWPDFFVNKYSKPERVPFISIDCCLRIVRLFNRKYFSLLIKEKTFHMRLLHSNVGQWVRNCLERNWKRKNLNLKFSMKL